MSGIFSFFTINLLNSAIRLATPIILAALGAALCNKAGVLNLAIDGKITVGAFVAIVTTYLIRNHSAFGMAHPEISTLAGVAAAMIVGALLGLFFAWLHVSFRVNLVVLAIAINILSLEVTVYLMRVLFKQSGTWSDPSIVQLPAIHLGFVESIPILGRLLSGYNIIVYISWAAVIIFSVLVYRTRFGRHLLAVGENEEAAVSVGISVRRVQYTALIISGILAGLAGAFLSVGHLTLFTRDMSSGRGWIGNAAALFGFNSPGGSFLAGLFFGFADAVALRLQNVTKIPPYIVQILPYVMTLVILAFVSWRARLKALRKSL
ncbi:MAG: ABC transporter permease [Treponema sp.]|jgi:simple sugar transport system permease protein|nr:ABC transporter permease [Treponema sp.]